MRRAHAFTLLELLLSVAVVAVLATLAVVGLSRLSDQRDARVCAAHLRQVYLLVQSYVADHNGYFPPILSDIQEDNITLHWRRAILPYMGLNAGGHGVSADVFHSKLICPPATRRKELPAAYREICSFGLNEYLGDPNQPKKRGIAVSRIRRPSALFFATETIVKPDGLPKESISPKDLSLQADQLGLHKNRTHQNVMFADGHIEFFDDVIRLRKIPYGVGRDEDVWTP